MAIAHAETGGEQNNTLSETEVFDLLLYVEVLRNVQRRLQRNDENLSSEQQLLLSRIEELLRDCDEDILHRSEQRVNAEFAMQFHGRRIERLNDFLQSNQWRVDAILQRSNTNRRRSESTDASPDGGAAAAAAAEVNFHAGDPGAERRMRSAMRSLLEEVQTIGAGIRDLLQRGNARGSSDSTDSPSSTPDSTGPDSVTGPPSEASYIVDPSLVISEYGMPEGDGNTVQVVDATSALHVERQGRGNDRENAQRNPDGASANRRDRNASERNLQNSNSSKPKRTPFRFFDPTPRADATYTRRASGNLGPKSPLKKSVDAIARMSGIKSAPTPKPEDDEKKKKEEEEAKRKAEEEKKKAEEEAKKRGEGEKEKKK